MDTMSTSDDALSHMVQLLCPKDDYKCLQILHYVQGLKHTVLKNKCISHSDVWCKDINELTCQVLDDTTALEEACKYNAAVSKLPSFMFRVTLRSDATSSSIKQDAKRAMRTVDIELSPQLVNLHQEVENKGLIKMLIRTHNEEEGHRLIQTCFVAETLRIQDRYIDP
jgi:hypothetical protein